MHFIFYNPTCLLVGTKKPHKLKDPKLYWLIISYQQDARASFPTPRSGTIISRCFSNVFKIKSCSCFLTKIASPPSNCWCYQQLSPAFSFLPFTAHLRQGTETLCKCESLKFAWNGFYPYPFTQTICSFIDLSSKDDCTYVLYQALHYRYISEQNIGLPSKKNYSMLKLSSILRELGGLYSKESACNAGDPGSIPGSERSPGEENDNPLPYSCLGNLTDRGAWWATVHGVTRSQTWLSH